MTWGYSENNRTPLVYSDQILNSDSRQKLNEILFGPKCLPWVDVKSPFVLKNASVLIMFPFLSPKHKRTTLSVLYYVSSTSSYFLHFSFLQQQQKSWAKPILSLPFFFEGSKIVQTVRRKLVGVCVFCIFVWRGMAGDG